jgi:integral membrane protein (TIGR01906 family)
MNATFQRILTILITILIPFFLLMTAIRILFTPLFMQLEYRAPGFPTDDYGFTLEDRLHWSRVSLEYLVNNSGIDYLANQQLPDGSPLYNERELSHMVDVKVLVQKMIVAWWILLAVLLALGLWAWRANWLSAFFHGLGGGGKLTVGLIVLILAAVAISFRALFTGFHEIFFTGDSWLFLYSDTLIRLFPLRFWQDGFIVMGVFTLVGAGVLIFLEKKLA